MNTNILTPKHLFQKDVHYVIPGFQRPYVWSHDDQWEPLWEDVRNVAESYLDELQRSGNDTREAEQHTSPHFLGAVVLKQVPTPAREIEQREVIDGQQRVTTLQLLLDAIQQICEESDPSYFKKVGRRMSKYVTNDKDLVEDDEDQILKLCPTRNDQEAFKHAMHNGLATNNFESSLIVQAHEFFQLQIRKWLDETTSSIETRIDALEVAATSKLQMVVIDLDQSDDPNLIFETLNARGTPLEQSDLIKNFVMSKVSGPQNDVWGDLDHQWWRSEVRQGRLFRPRVDMLINYWLAMQTGSEVSPSRVFDAFRDYVGGMDFTQVMANIKNDLANYRDFETEQGRNPEEKNFYYHVDVTQAGVITPLLLLLLSAEEETRIKTFNVLESFLIRRMICRQTTKQYNLLVLDLSSRLRERGLDNADVVTAEFFKRQTAYAREWPSDDTVTKSLLESPLYRLLTRGRLRLVLEGVEHRLRMSGKTEHPDVPRNLTIEHLMPVAWSEDKWPLPNNIDSEIAAIQRNSLIHSIGNLTLATQHLNSSLSNDSWQNKKAALMEHSVLLLNNELTSQESWDDETIQSRSSQIAQLVLQRWPGPTAECWFENS